MKRQPRKIKQWAKEAYESLEKAIVIFYEETPVPTEHQKMELIAYSVPFAAMNRGIKDSERIEQANEVVLDNLSADLANKEVDEPIIYSILFLLAYLDAHVSFGILNDFKVQDIMSYLAENYEINIDL